MNSSKIAKIETKSELERWKTLVKRHGLSWLELSKATGYNKTWCKKKCEALFNRLLEN